MPYDKLGYLEFGQRLLETGDLDPVYIMLTKAELPHKVMCRWLLAYWCFYSCGMVSEIAEADDYWDAMLVACEPGKPRGMERRHFRGPKSEKAVRWLAANYGDADNAIEFLVEETKLPGNGVCTLKNVEKRAVSWPMFGHWIGWKIADMLERVMRVPIVFDDYDRFVIPEVAKAIDLIEPREPNQWSLIERLQKEFSNYLAPPWQDRPVNCQEVETIMCKFKAHLHGFYYLGKDTIEVGHSLRDSVSPLAHRLAELLPKEA